MFQLKFISLVFINFCCERSNDNCTIISNNIIHIYIYNTINSDYSHKVQFTKFTKHTKYTIIIFLENI